MVMIFNNNLFHDVCTQKLPWVIYREVLLHGLCISLLSLRLSAMFFSLKRTA